MAGGCSVRTRSGNGRFSSNSRLTHTGIIRRSRLFKAVILGAALGSVLLMVTVGQAGSASLRSPREGSAAPAVTPSEVRDSSEANSNQRLIPICPQTSGPHCNILAQSDGAGNQSWSESPVGFGATDLESAYGISSIASSQGSGNTVALVDAYNDKDAEADMNLSQQLRTCCLYFCVWLLCGVESEWRDIAASSETTCG